MKPIYSLFIGRYQNFHDGHKWMFRQQLEKGKNILIAIRDTEVSENNPKPALQIFEEIMSDPFVKDNPGRVTAMIIPDIESVNYGRGVGYGIIEHVPPTQIGAISGTKIREELKKNGKL